MQSSYSYSLLEVVEVYVINFTSRLGRFPSTCFSTEFSFDGFKILAGQSFSIHKLLAKFGGEDNAKKLYKVCGYFRLCHYLIDKQDKDEDEGNTDFGDSPIFSNKQGIKVYFVPVPIDRRKECSKEGKHNHKNEGYV